MISEEQVDAVFDELEEKFKALAKLEDKFNEYQSELAEYKEGSRKADQCRRRIQDLQPILLDAQREFRLAGMRADRLRVKVDVLKTAQGG